MREYTEAEQALISKLRTWREVYLDRKKTRKGDSLLTLILTLKFYLSPKLKSSGIKKAKKFLENYLADAKLQEILAEAGSFAHELLYCHFLEASSIYAQSCAEDAQYGSRFLSLIKMKKEDVAIKAGLEIYQQLIAGLLRMDLAEAKLLALAFHQGYQESFESKSYQEYLAGDQEALSLFEASQDLFTEIIGN